MGHLADTRSSAEELADRLVEYRRHLHQYPELSGEERKTTAKLQEWLAEAGIQTVDYGLNTGVIAEIGEGNSGPIIALRADIDALPIQEETGLPYASRNQGKMHACGHDFHTAALLGAAILLKNKESGLRGKVRLIFQPAEEKAVGALQVIESGALEGVKAILGLHNKPDLPVGAIGIKEGPLMAAADGFVLEVKGQGTHAAVPEVGVDPIVAASQIVTSLQSIVSRNLSSLQQAVVSVTRFHSGTSWNVIPENAVLDGTIRTFEENARATVRERFAQIVEGVAAAYQVKTQLRWIQGPPAVRNDSRLAALAREATAALGLTAVEPAQSLAGEDFAYYQRKVPGLFLFVGTSGSREWHHPAFDLDERALPITAEYLAELTELALRSLSEQPDQESERMTNFRESITIREADEAEQEAVRSVMLEAYGQYADLFPAEVWKKYQDEIGNSVSGKGAIARLVAEIDGTIIGSVQLYPSAEAAYGRTDMGINSPVIRFLCVSPLARGRGVAAALIEEVVKRSLAIGAADLYLHTVDMMASAIRLYERMGFERAYEKEFHNGLHLVKCYRLSLPQAKRVEAAELIVLIRPEVGI